MTLPARRSRYFLVMFNSVLIGFCIAVLIDYPYVYVVPLGAGAFIAIGIAALFIPIKKYDIVLKEDSLRIPVSNWFTKPIEIPLSEIDLDKSEIVRFGEARIVTNEGETFIISRTFHFRDNIRVLFDELTKIKSLHNTRNN